MTHQILLVEDEAPLREWVSYELETEGYHVLRAPNGLSGLKAAQSQLPDLILLDVQLPGMDGFQLCRELQNNPLIASIPVIFLTARTTLNDKLIGFESGGIDYLTKPFKMSELKARVKASLHRRQVEQQRAEALLDKYKQNLSQNMRHELITPISQVLTALELLGREAVQKKPAQMRLALDSARSGAHGLHWLIEDLLLVNQSATQEIAIFRQPIDLLLSTNVILQQLSSKYHAPKFNFELVIPENCMIYMTQKHVRHILYHLLDNACKFNRWGGKVELIAKPIGQAGIEIVIRDEGEGIDPEQHERIFDKFFQLDMSMTRANDGLGLGLYLARILARAYGGDVTVESQRGQGAIFRFTLPDEAPDWL